MNRKLQWKMMDNYKRKIFLKNELKKKILYSISCNQNLPLLYRYLAYWNKNKISKLISIVQHRDRCVLTGRVWNVNHYTKISRFKFRSEIYKGNLPGFSRASW